MTKVLRRRNFIILTLAALPLFAFSKIKSIITMRTDKGFKVNSGEARFGIHYKMKGVTLNTLDIKI